jgi:hypothetical protein
LLAAFKASADKAEAKAQIYDQNVQQTVAKTEAIQQYRKYLDTAAQAFMKACDGYSVEANSKLTA